MAVNISRVMTVSLIVLNVIAAVVGIVTGSWLTIGNLVVVILLVSVLYD